MLSFIITVYIEQNMYWKNKQVNKQSLDFTEKIENVFARQDREEESMDKL